MIFDYRICQNKRPPRYKRPLEKKIFQRVHKTDGFWWVIFQRGEYTKPMAFDGQHFQRGEYTKPMGFDGWFFKGGNTQNQ